MLSCVKFFCALTAVVFPMAAGAGALATVAATPEVAIGVVIIGAGLGLLGVFGFATAERTEEQRHMAMRQIARQAGIQIEG